MANHKSAKKRIRQTEKRRVNTKWQVSRLRTELKKIHAFITDADKDGALKQFPVIQALYSKLAKGSAIRKDTAGRKVGRIAAAVSKL